MLMSSQIRGLMKGKIDKADEAIFRLATKNSHASEPDPGKK